MEFQEVVKNRYSCKKYDGRQVDQSKLDAILEAGRLAPTAKNTQEQRVYVIRSEEALAKVDRATPCRYGASTVLAVAYDSKEVFTYPGGRYDSGAEDATIVATHLMLAAENEGLATLWVGSFDPTLLRDILPGAEAYDLVAMINVGYPAPESQPSAMHNVRKTMAELVTRII